MEDFSLGDYVGWGIGALFFLLAIPVAFWAGRRNRQRPDLRSAVSFDGLAPIESVFGPRVRITFDGNAVDEVSRTHIAIWNERGDHVDADQILPRDRVRVVVEEGSILQARVVTYSREQIGLRVDQEADSAIVSFDFLDPGDGGIIEVVHTGRRPAELKGTVKGASFGRPIPASLGKGARAAIRAQRWSRVKYMTHRGRRHIIVNATLALATAAMSATVLFILSRYLRTPTMVPLNEYDLSSLSGQAEFARAVERVGEFTWWQVTSMGLVALFALLVTFLFSRRVLLQTKAVVPRTVVRVDLDPYRGPTAAPRPAAAQALAADAEGNDAGPKPGGSDIEQASTETPATPTN